MSSRGMESEFPPPEIAQLAKIIGPAADNDADIRDLTNLPWCSIDNDDSMDLDQLSVSEKLSNGSVKIYVAIADVDALVKQGSPIDLHAKNNTTSVYTGVAIFPMLPEKLSTDLTSLAQDQPRLAIIIEYQVSPTGNLSNGTVYRGRVKNQAKLAYNATAAWLEGKGHLPETIAKVRGLDEQLKTQDEVAQNLRRVRHQHGALELETNEFRAVLDDMTVVDLERETHNRAKELIEDLMIAANETTSRFLESNDYPSLQRVVKSPERWNKIVDVAKTWGETLPIEADCIALSQFLSKARTRDPERFPDLSLTVVKLLGRGEYIALDPGEKPIGHFGLAVGDYTHSTAPNRRYPDLITQRIIKAALKKMKCPYSSIELKSLATHCTEQENASDRVERQVRKSAAALFLAPKIGQSFDAIVTGVSQAGTWARVLSPPVEGKVVHGSHGLDVGDRVRVKLTSVNVNEGWIDFVRA